MKLTEKIIKEAPITADIYYLWDKTIPGFGVKVIPNGKKKYLLKYRPKNSTAQRWYLMGETTILKLEKARQEAINLLSQITQGRDPQEEKSDARNAMSLSDFYEIFKKNYIDVNDLSDNHLRNIGFCWELHIKPVLGQKYIANITENDIAHLHGSMKEIKPMANRTLSLLSLMFNQMERWKFRPIKTNPCVFVKKYKENARQRYLSPAEIFELWRALDEVDAKYPSRIYSTSAIRLIFLTGARKNEILPALWEYVSFEQKVILLPDSKTGQKTIYLSDEAVTILKKLYNMRTDKTNPYIIVNTKKGGYIKDVKKMWNTVTKQAGIKDCHIHDLRHTAASIALANGHSLAEIGQLLGHASPITTQRYAHLVNSAAFNVAHSVAALDQTWTTRGDTFNAVFDSKLTVYEALSRCAKVGRAIPFIQGGIVRFVRDEPKNVPVALFGPRNIVKDSLSIKYLMPSEDTADSVCIQYFSEKTWKTSEITGSCAGSTSDKTATVELFGCTNKEQALREATYMALANRYRRRIVTFNTELEGLIPSYGDLIAITHDMAKWGQGGEIIGKDGFKLTLSEPVAFSEMGTHYVALRQKNGTLSGPYAVTAGELTTEVVLSEEPAVEVLTGTDTERTHFAFGIGDKWSVLARVTGIRPRSTQIEITAVIEDSRVHSN